MAKNEIAFIWKKKREEKSRTGKIEQFGKNRRKVNAFHEGSFDGRRGGGYNAVGYIVLPSRPLRKISF